jgi:thiol-disulfide isomerase/thioredoxin
MKISIYLLFLFISSNLFAQQKVLLIDSAVAGARSRYGIRDLDLEFKEFSYRAIDGTVYTKDSLKDKVTFIDFWFSNCPPCVEEFETMNNLFKKYRANKNFLFLSFAWETDESALEVAKKYQLEYPIICINRVEASRLMFNSGFPQMVVTDKNRTIRFIKVGGYIKDDVEKTGSTALLEQEIDRVLKEYK